jgi:hypothetical protein
MTSALFFENVTGGDLKVLRLAHELFPRGFIPDEKLIAAIERCKRAPADIWSRHWRPTQN